MTSGLGNVVGGSSVGSDFPGSHRESAGWGKRENVFIRYVEHYPEKDLSCLRSGKDFCARTTNIQGLPGSLPVSHMFWCRIPCTYFLNFESQIAHFAHPSRS